MSVTLSDPEAIAHLRTLVCNWREAPLNELVVRVQALAHFNISRTLLMPTDVIAEYEAMVRHVQREVRRHACMPLGMGR